MLAYSYLFYSLFFLLILTIILWLRRDLVKDTVPALVFGAVAGPVSEILYFSDYWTPESAFKVGPVLLEDMLFGVAIFGLALVLYPFARQKSLGPIASGGERHIRTFGTLLAGASLMFCFMVLLNVNSVFATALTFVLLWMFIAFHRKDLFLPGLLSGLYLAGISVLFYAVFLNVLVLAGYLEQIWKLSGSQLGITLLGNVPVSEIVWFLGTGCFLSVFELFVNKREYHARDARKAAALHELP